MAKVDQGNILVERVVSLRRDLAKKNGVWSSPPSASATTSSSIPALTASSSAAKEIARGYYPRWQLAYLAAENSGEPLIPLDGEATTEPAFGLPAKWIAEHDKARAELAGCTVVEAVSVLITHLSEVLRKHSAELLGREDLKQLVDKVRETSPTLVEELIPGAITMALLHRILILLLEERVPISNMTRILECLANHAPACKDPVELTERVRGDLGRIICDRCREGSKLSAIVLDPRLEMELRRALHEKNLVLQPAQLEKLIVCLANAWRKSHLAGKEVALLTDSALR